MYCKYCGKELPNNAKFCHNCGAKIEAETIEDPSFQPISLGSNSPEYKAVPVEQDPNAFGGFAITSMIFGILTSIIVFFASISSLFANAEECRSIRSFLFVTILFLGIPGIVLGAIGKQSKNHKGKAITGKVLSLVFSIIGSIIWTLLIGY